jgi:hypothetical protein
MEEQASADQTQSPETSQGSLWRLQGIFFEPAKTFEDINLQPGFLLPLILCVAITFAAWLIIGATIDLDRYLESQVRAAPQAEGMSDEIIEQQAQLMSMFTAWVGPLIGPPLMVLVVSGVLMLMIYISGSETTLKKLLGVTSHTFFLQTVVSSVLLTLVFLLSSEAEAVNLQNPYYTNLGHLLDSKESPFLARLAASIDLITIYVIWLLGLGISKISSKMTVGKGIILVVIPFLLYVLGAAGVAALTS